MQKLPETLAEAGAYFMDGALTVVMAYRATGTLSFDKLSGWCGFVSDLCQHAEYSDALAYAGYEAVGDYPGVYGYEVQIPFGQWFAEYYIEYNDAPTADLCRVWLLNATEGFFLAGGDPIGGLSEALMKVEASK